MKTFKNLLSIVFLLIVASSCEPEEIPIEPLNVPTSHISADTGDKDDEFDDRGGKSTADTGDKDDEFDDRDGKSSADTGDKDDEFDDRGDE